MGLREEFNAAILPTARSLGSVPESGTAQPLPPAWAAAADSLASWAEGDAPPEGDAPKIHPPVTRLSRRLRTRTSRVSDNAAETKANQEISAAAFLRDIIDSPNSALCPLQLNLQQHKEEYSARNAQKLVLAVDDSHIMHKAIRLMLETHGYRVVCVNSGVAALKYLVTEELLPDVMLLDLLMPAGLDGIETALRVRRVWSSAKLPIIILSASGDRGNIEMGLNNLRCNDFVKKPVTQQELVARVAAQIRMREALKMEADSAVLRTMLPPHILSRISRGERDIAEAHRNVTCLFSDVVGFTELCSRVPTLKVVRALNEMFTSFDAAADANDVSKVDVIGDAYFAIAGHTRPDDGTHATRMIDQALDMLAIMSKMAMPGENGDGSSSLKIRIGIHTGPAHAGVVGIKCPRYTFFGDTVNVASRMESHGFPMCIHVSAATRDQLLFEGEFSSDEFVPCPVRHIKGKGEMLTYLMKVGEWDKACKQWGNGDVCRTEDGDAPSASSSLEGRVLRRNSHQSERVPTLAQLSQ